MKKLGLMFLAGTMLSTTIVRAEEDCKTAPDCADLGYTMDASACGGAALYCPWDLTKASCKEKSPLPILYGDGTVSNIVKSNPKPIGIVFDETRKLAIALTDIRANGKPYGKDENPQSVSMSSSTIYGGYILSSCKEDDVKTCDVDGRDNTDILLRAYHHGVSPAAQAANLYEPEGCTATFCKKNKWFIPSIRDLRNIFLQYADVKKALGLVLDTEVVRFSGTYASSTVKAPVSQGKTTFFGVRVQGMNGEFYFSSGVTYLRPVVYYGEEVKKTDVSVPCAVGALLGGDGKCYTTKLNSGVSVVGVVFDTEKRLAVALTDIKKDGTPGSENMKWSSISYENRYDTAIPNCSDYASCDEDGRANTDILLKETQGAPYEAAQAVNKYEPSGCTAAFCKKGKWFLPSYGELGPVMHGLRYVFYNSLNLIPGLNATKFNFENTFQDSSYWVSTESGEHSAGTIHSSGYIYITKYREKAVRPIVKY